MLDFTRGKPMTDSFKDTTKVVNFDVTGDFKTISAGVNRSSKQDTPKPSENSSFSKMAQASINKDKADGFVGTVDNDDDDIMIG